MSSPLSLTCPFCGVGCDDLSVDLAGDAPRIATHGCALAADQFEAAVSSGAALGGGDVAGDAAWIEARRAPLAAALSAVAERLARAHRPLVVCAACDVATTRGAVRLADRLRATIDDGVAPAERAARAATMRLGLSTATLTELRNRADLIVLVGETPLAGMPRLVERYLAPPAHLAEARERRFLQIGPAEGAIPAALGPLTRLPCAGDDLERMLGRLQSRLAPPRAGGDAAREPALDATAELLGAARYAAWVWQPSRLGPDADLLTERLAELLDALNERHHHVGVPLHNGPGGATAAQTIIWQTGLAPPVAFGAAPRHDPAAPQAADFRLWISPLAPAPPPAASVPTAVLGHPATPPAAGEIVIPVGVPAVDHGGHTFTADAAEVRHLVPFLDRPHLSAEQILDHLLALTSP